MTTITDDFNRANSTSLGSIWTETNGDWHIDSNALQVVTGNPAIVITSSELATTDHYIQATYVDPSGTASKGIIARADAGPNNYYLVRNNGNDWSLFKALSGNFTGIGQWVAPAAAGDVAKLECIGTSIKVYINGVERISVVDSDVTIGKHVGFRDASSGTHYDDFTAADDGEGSGGGNGGSLVTSISDDARANMLTDRGLSEPQNLSVADLMRLVLEDDLQTLVTETDASAATHLQRYLIDLRNA